MKITANSVKLKLGSYIKSMLNNKFRFWLTTIGMVVGAIVFLAGFAVLDSFEKSYKVAYENWGEDVLYLANDAGIDTQSRNFFKNNMPESIHTYYGDKQGFIEKIGDDDFYTTINPVTANFVYNYQISNNFNTLENHPILEMPLYFEGNVWEENSVAREIVINEMSAYFYFGKTDPIGQKVTLNSRKYKVIGVISNSRFDNNLISNYNENKVGNSLPEGKIYMSFNCYKENFGESNIDKAIFKFATLSECSQSVVNMNAYYRQQIENGQVLLTDTRTIDGAIVSKMAEYKLFMAMAIVGILLLSGFVIMNTLFFNVKEKISEIGIRKAFGASNLDIMSQFIFEGLIYGCLAFILGCLMILICLNVISIVTLVCNLHFLITINISSILYCAIIVIAEGIIFSIAPAIYASKLKIVDSLKFE